MTKHNTRNKRNKRRVKKVRYLGIGGVAMGAGVAALAGGPAAGAAVAMASTYTVTNGGPYTATNPDNNFFTDLTTAQSIVCPTHHVKASGSIPNSVSRSPKSIGTVTAFNPGTTTSPCSGPGNIGFAGHLVGADWHINAASSTNGVVTGSITGIHLQASSTTVNPPLCEFSVSGTAHGTYTNSTGILNVSTASLTVHGGGLACLGLVNNSDSATYAGPLQVTTAAGHPTIHHNTS